MISGWGIVFGPVKTVITFCVFVINTWLKPGANRIINVFNALAVYGLAHFLS